MQECIFCKIVRGEIPCAKLAETDKILSFLDVSPVNKGHALVIPKEHYENLLELETEELTECTEIIQNVARAVVKVTGAEGFNVLQNNSECAGQVVPHVHFHIIPRRPDDGFSFGWRQGSYDAGEMEALSVSIRELI